MRSFLAFETSSDSLRNNLAGAQIKLKELDPVNVINPELFHLTIKFLGDRSPSELEELDRTFQRRLPAVGPLELSVTGVGAFPSIEQPSVLWAGVEENEQLYELVSTVEEIAVEHGVDPEDRDYHAHITLARVSDRMDDPEPIVKWIRNHADRDFGTLRSDRLILFESKLQPEGPEYIQKEWWPL